MTNLVECPYKSAEELEITEAERDGLMRLIPKLFGGEISPGDFRMNSWCSCIRYHLNVELGEPYPSTAERSLSLRGLFGGMGGITSRPACWEGIGFDRATPAEGAVAVTHFLSHGA